MLLSARCTNDEEMAVGLDASESEPLERRGINTAEAAKVVGFVLYDGCTLLDFTGATQIFAGWASGWKPVWIAPELDRVTTSEGLAVVPSHTFGSHPALDIVFVPGGDGDGVAATMRDARYLDWLGNVAHTKEPWVGSVCVGAFILAAAGLLRDAVATTHWRLLDVLRRLAPTYGITVPPGFPRAVIDEAQRRFSGGGVSSSIDLALTLVRELDDADVATAAALIVQYAPEVPLCVAPGNPDSTDPAVLDEVANKPSVVENLVTPITLAVEELGPPC